MRFALPQGPLDFSADVAESAAGVAGHASGSAAAPIGVVAAGVAHDGSPAAY